MLELLKIVPEDKGISYPQCVKSAGTSPKQYKPTTLPAPLEEDEEPKKSATTASIIKEELAPIVLEKDPLDEEAEGFIPLDEDGIEELSDEETKEPGDDDAEEPGDDDDTDIEPEGSESDD